MRTARMLIALVCLLPGACWAGANATGRAWVSWDRSGLVTELAEVTFERRDVFVHVEAPDFRALAIHLMYSIDGDSTAALVSAEPDSQSGWAEHSTEVSSFYGDSTYDWIISFPEEERIKVKYSIESPGAADTLRGTIWVSGAIVQDSQGELDTLLVGPAARLLGRSGPTFSVPTDSLPGLVIVEFAPGVVASGHQHVFGQDILEPALRDSLAGSTGFSVGKRVFPSAAEGETLRVSATGDTVLCRDLSRMYVFKVDDFVPVAGHLQQIAVLPGVLNVNAVSAMVEHRTPNDPLYNQQWHLASSGAAAIGAPLAWDATIGTSSLLVCVIDSGIDYNHTGEFGPFDNSRIIRGRDFGDGDFDVYDDTPPNDRGHGTNVAGIVGALTDNTFQVAGIMWTGRMLIHKTSDTYGACPLSCFSYHPSYAVAAAIDDATRSGASVINMSIGYPFAVPSLHDILFKAWWDVAHGEPVAVASYTAYRLGLMLVASAGNDGHNWVDKPAAFPWVMGAGATDINGDRASFSNYGARLDLLAPGVGITTTAMIDQGGYTTGFSGTSASSPMTAGSAALVFGESIGRSLGLSNEDVMQLLMRTCRDVPDPGVGRDEETGWGHLDASRALARLRLPYRFVRAAVQGGSVSLVEDLHDHNFIGNGDLPGGRYYVRTYEVRNHVNFCGPLSEVPLMWGRERDSRGWSAANANGELPFANVDNVTTSGFDAVTYVYWVEYDIVGSAHFRGWWPCPPEQATMAYAASTRGVLSSLGITGPHADCANTWSAATCGGESELTYEWYERPPGGAWSPVVATTPTYTRYLPGSDLEFRVEVTSGAVSLADTHYVNYRSCTVAVEPAAAVLELSLSVTPNPVTGATAFSMTIPTAQRVELSVYDVSGRLVSTPFRGVMQPGTHRIHWGRGRLPAGLYFARLTGASDERRVRLALLR